ncbi:MAG: hypothetical protein ABI140_02165, partial [Jatrophihabitantaceae bacterium]
MIAIIADQAQPAGLWGFSPGTTGTRPQPLSVPMVRGNVSVSTKSVVREMTKFVFDFAEGNRDQKDLLGGKGANLAEMT